MQRFFKVMIVVKIRNRHEERNFYLLFFSASSHSIVTLSSQTLTLKSPILHSFREVS